MFEVSAECNVRENSGIIFCGRLFLLYCSRWKGVTMQKGNLGFVNGNVITMEKKMAKAEGILIQKGKITFVGSSQEVQKRAEREHIQVEDLKGKTLLPGFHDCHVHVMGTGMAYLGADLYECSSVDEVIKRLQKEAEKSEQGWICGVRLEESRLAEKRPPTLEELTEAFPDRGVHLVDRGLHYTVVNKKACEEIGFVGNEKGFGRDKDNRPNGRLSEEANSKARNFFNDTLTMEQRKQIIQSVENQAIQKGITTIHAMEGGEMFSDKDIPAFLEYAHEQKIDIVLYWDIMDIEKIKKAGLRRIGTDILSDGSIGSKTAAFDEPYADCPDTCGICYYSDEQLIRFIEEALQNRMQCGFHAIGQKAIRQVIDCYEKAYEKCPWEDARFRIEHFGFCDERDIKRAAKNHIIISTQPSFSYLRGGEGSVYQIRTGKERERRAYPNKTFLDYGIVVAGGSDSNVTPMDALLGIHAAVNHPYPEHRVSVEQALRMFTIDGAYAAHEEMKKGSLAPGKLGDVVVLSKNPYETELDEMKDIEVVSTIKEGNILYQKKQEL